MKIAAKNRFGFGPESIDPVMVLTEPTPGEPAAKAVWKPPKRSARDLVERLQKLE